MKINQKLGVKAKDTVTGLTGILTARIEFLNGCVQYCLTPPIDKDGKIVKDEYIDYTQLELVEDELSKSTETKSSEKRIRGGFQRNCPR